MSDKASSLLYTRISFPVVVLAAVLIQFLISPIEQHSKKPDAAREKIVALMGDLPRIELFARQQTPGWDIWGNELPNSIEM